MPMPTLPTMTASRRRQAMPDLCPVIGPDGREYPSQAAAAQHFGVNPGTIIKHLNRYGDLSRLGKTRDGNQNRAVPLTIGNITWPSRIIAAQELGVTRMQLKHWLSDKASAGMKGKLAAAVMRYIATKDSAAYRHRAAKDVLSTRPIMKQ